MHISVTQRDIDAAEQSRESRRTGSSYNAAMHCPLARAATKAFGISSSVGINAIYVGDDEEYDLPTVAKEWQHRFDFGDDVEPFEFDTIPFGYSEWVD